MDDLTHYSGPRYTGSNPVIKVHWKLASLLKGIAIYSLAEVEAPISRGTFRARGLHIWLH